MIKRYLFIGLFFIFPHITFAQWLPCEINEDTYFLTIGSRILCMPDYEVNIGIGKYLSETSAIFIEYFYGKENFSNIDKDKDHVSINKWHSKTHACQFGYLYSLCPRSSARVNFGVSGNIGRETYKSVQRNAFAVKAFGQFEASIIHILALYMEAGVRYKFHVPLKERINPYLTVGLKIHLSL